MSADWWFEFENDNKIDSSYHTIEDWRHTWNLTYNVSPMLRDAGWVWPDDRVWSTEYLEGARAADIGEKAMYVLRNLEKDPEKYRAMNPDNGWGSYDDTLEVWREFVEAIREQPDAVIGTWF